MSYIANRLEPGEKLLCQAATSKLAWINSLVIALALLAALFHFGGLSKLGDRSELTLTNRRIIGKSRSAFGSTSLPLAKIDRVAVKRGLLGILMRYGNIIITDADGETYSFKNIAQPALFKREADEAIEIAVLGGKLSDFDKPDAPADAAPPAPPPASAPDEPAYQHEVTGTGRPRVDPDQW